MLGPMHPLLSDPWVAEKIEAALRRHGDRLTDRQKAAFREKMAWTFANHPAAQRLLAREHPAEVDSSGERPTNRAEEESSTGDPGTGIREKKGNAR